MKTLSLLTLLLCGSFFLSAQNCRNKLENAQRAYFDGRFEEVEKLLSPCLNEFEDRIESSIAWELLCKARLVLRQEEAATEAMRGLLEANPFYQPVPNLSVSTENIYQKFELINQWEIGLNLSYLNPRFELLKDWSTAGTHQELGFEAQNSLGLELFLSYPLYKGLRLKSALGFQALGFSRSELLLEHQLQESTERYQFLSPSLGFEYEHFWSAFGLFAEGGLSGQRLLQGEADFSLQAQRYQFPTPPVSFSQERNEVDVKDFRNPWLGNYYWGAGLKIRNKRNMFVLAYRFHQGHRNFSNPAQRYRNRDLRQNLFYLPNDLILSYGSWQLSYVYTIIKPKRKSS